MILNKIALALDFSDRESITEILTLLDPKPVILKIGLQAISSLGIKESIKLVESLCPGSEIFLDMKLHDIPNTVKKTVENLRDLNIKFLTVHASGGHRMLSEAQKAAGPRMQTVAVTLLTASGGDEKSDTDTVLRLAEDAVNAGINYVVCSALECRQIKKSFPSLKVITPGIRLPKSEISPKENFSDDQKRILSPEDALGAGSDLLVIGRPVYTAENPQSVWQRLCNTDTPRIR